LGCFPILYLVGCLVWAESNGASSLELDASSPMACLFGIQSVPWIDP
jgi:hypothetical protein